MADQDFTHTAELIKAAIPFVDTKTQGMAELFAKLMDLMGSLNTFGKSGKLATLGLESMKIDVEGLLKGVRPICTIKERAIVDRILNIFNMKRMFEMYNNMMSAMKTMQDLGGFNFGDFSSGNDAENVAGNFTNPNFESIFQNFSNNFNNESKSSTDTDNSAFHFGSEKSEPNNKEAPYSSEAEKTTANSTGSSFSKNNPMFEMLKTMVPPEQMSTFENLSMLFNTMSYDSNSKSDDNKEHSDG